MTTETVHDPVCHMDIDPKGAEGSADHDGQTYYFCSRGCKMDFEEDPAGVLAAEAAYDHSQPMDEGMMGATPAASKRPWWQFWRS